jgi:hypothetical protein
MKMKIKKNGKPHRGDQKWLKKEIDFKKEKVFFRKTGSRAAGYFYSKYF